ncbi:unnamed protein product [Clavelina lepadiformis]|uniref:Uncharacterized protein n=1 Tax=Clavelina lepadiformis TaxID=159417 RepID=A0ABP0GZ26_CLALP
MLQLFNNFFSCIFPKNQPKSRNFEPTQNVNFSLNLHSAPAITTANIHNLRSRAHWTGNIDTFSIVTSCMRPSSQSPGYRFKTAQNGTTGPSDPSIPGCSESFIIIILVETLTTLCTAKKYVCF